MGKMVKTFEDINGWPIEVGDQVSVSVVGPAPYSPNNSTHSQYGAFKGSVIGEVGDLVEVMDDKGDIFDIDPKRLEVTTETLTLFVQSLSA